MSAFKQLGADRTSTMNTIFCEEMHLGDYRSVGCSKRAHTVISYHPHLKCVLSAHWFRLVSIDVAISRDDHRAVDLEAES